MKNILVVDDHPMVLEIMAMIVQSVFAGANVHRVSTFAEAAEAARNIDSLDMTLLDLGLPGCPGITSLTRFREIAPAVPVVVISATEDRAVVLAALQAGAIGYIPKTSKPDVIAAALRLVAAGGRYLPLEVLSAPASANEESISLTDRQLDVLRLITQGHRNKDIARRLSISTDTVKQHAKIVFAALGIDSRSQAARAAEQGGIKLS